MMVQFEEIDKNLRKNGWIPSVLEKEDELGEYVKNYGNNVIGIEICLDTCSLGVYGRYGVCSVQIIKYEYNMPYIKDDIRRMQQLFEDAERDLLKAGVPFRPTYGFSGQCLESRLHDNLDLRSKYQMDKLEQEAETEEQEQN